MRAAGCSQGLKKVCAGWTRVGRGGVGAALDGSVVGGEVGAAAATGVGVAGSSAPTAAGGGSLEAAAPMPFVPTAVAKTISELRT